MCGKVSDGGFAEAVPRLVQARGCQHTSAYVSIRQHTSAYVEAVPRQHTYKLSLLPEENKLVTEAVAVVREVRRALCCTSPATASEK